MTLRDVARRAGLRPAYRSARRGSNYARAVRGFRRFRGLNDGRLPVRWSDRWLFLADERDPIRVDPHYFYHPAWAARVLARTRPARHVDVGSALAWAADVSAFVPVDYYELRPPSLQPLDGLTASVGDLCSLPFESGSVLSLSCMHTLEHVGLGRYGDPIDPAGDVRAAAELSRVLAPGGDLLVVVPVGRPRVRFNSGRIYSHGAVLGMFPGLDVREFMLIRTDGCGGCTGLVYGDEAVALVPGEGNGCGCFWFRKPG